jgi:hypothetical protein
MQHSRDDRPESRGQEVSVPMLAEDQKVSGLAELRQHSGRRTRAHDWPDLGAGPISLLSCELLHQVPLPLDLGHRVRPDRLRTGCEPAVNLPAMDRIQRYSATAGLFLGETQRVAGNGRITDC